MRTTRRRCDGPERAVPAPEWGHDERALQARNTIGSLAQAFGLGWKNEPFGLELANALFKVEFWFPIGDTEVAADAGRRHVAAIENLLTGERHPVEWGGVRLRIDPVRNPALLFQCLA